METTFVYHPCSGDRVFAENPNPIGLAVVVWANGCRHIVGNHVVLAWGPGRRVDRERWTAVAKQFVSCFGGLAWDSQGEISIVVHPANAFAAVTLMGGRAPEMALDRPDYRPSHLAALAAAGWSLYYDERNLRIGAYAGPGPIRVGLEWSSSIVEVYTSSETARKREVCIFYPDGFYVHVTAPETWDVKTVWGANRREADDADLRSSPDDKEGYFEARQHGLSHEDALAASGWTDD